MEFKEEKEQNQVVIQGARGGARHKNNLFEVTRYATPSSENKVCKAEKKRQSRAKTQES